MAESAKRDVEQVEEFIAGRELEHLRGLSQRVRSLLQGQGNSHFNVVLEPNETETIIRVSFASGLSSVQFSAASASTATAIAAGAIWAEASEGEITIHHDSDPADDRKLAVELRG